jgi:elongator complex protein 3
MMPGLPGADREKDIESFKKIFTDARFKPDMVKIYPCLVVKGTRLHSLYKEGVYKPYMTDEAAQLVAEIKKIVPPWIRIMRVQRDIPAKLITAGVDKSNLRQIVQRNLQTQGLRCRCIRCREVGHRIKNDNVKPDPEKVRILTTKYDASEGEEVFISAEDTENDVLVGYLRLRIPSARAHRPEVKAEPCTIVRELHVYGSLVPVGRHWAEAWQHKGYGGILLHEAERTTKRDYGFKKILVISALGTKQYYERFGYDRNGIYMSKMLGEHN